MTSHDFYMFKRGLPLVMDGTEEALDEPVDDKGYSYVDFYDFKFWREKVCTSTEVSNHFTNKLSISNMGFGNVIMAVHFTPGPGNGSFTSSSFTNTSFTI